MGGGVTKGSVLLVDDDAVFRNALKRHLEGEDYELATASDAEEGLERLSEDRFDLVLTDLKMPGLDGLDFLRRARELQRDVAVIVITGFGSPERSLEALRTGAFWYIEKSYEDMSTVGHLVNQALELQHLRATNRQLQCQLRVRYGFDNIVGTSQALRETLDLVRRVAETEATILILGESGVGKELIARMIHAVYNSRRADGPFEAVLCSRPPGRDLLESGAVRSREAARSPARIQERPGLLQPRRTAEPCCSTTSGAMPLPRCRPRSCASCRRRSSRLLTRWATRRADQGTISVILDHPRRGSRAAHPLAEGNLRTDLYHRLASVVPVRVSTSLAA